MSEPTEPVDGVRPATVDDLRQARADRRAAEDRLTDLRTQLDRARADYEGRAVHRVALAARVARSEAEATQLEAKVARAEAVAAVGLGAAWADRLHGNTADELLADAHALAEVVGLSGPTPRPAPPGKPRSVMTAPPLAPSGGGDPTGATGPPISSPPTWQEPSARRTTARSGRH